MSDDQQRRPRGSSQIIVLGMHRSGTSATAGLLHACGAHVGGPDEIKIPSRVNPRGFFERWDVRAVCDDALQAADAAWWRVSRFGLEQVSPLVRQALAEKAAAVVAGLDRHPIWVMKDPRLCLTLPLFRDRLGKGAVVVMVARHPMEVARSLRHRDGFPMDASLALWEAYAAAALRNAAGMPRVVVHYSGLTQEPGVAGRKLISDLARAGVTGLSQPDFTEVIDASLRHHREEPSDEGAMTPAQQELWRRLSDGAVDQPDGPRLSGPARRLLEKFEAGQLRAIAEAEAPA